MPGVTDVGWWASPEATIGLLGLILLSLGTLWVFVRWLLSGPPTPDPWGQEVAEELKSEEAVALCHRCLAPHNELSYFCKQCGAPVGDYTNLMPYLYLFSVGHTLRIGTSGEYRRSPLTVFGFFLLGIAEYLLFAPVYWFMCMRKLRSGIPTSPGAAVPPPPELPEKS